VNDDALVWEEAAAPEGRYANSFRVGHNAFEIVLDFGQAIAESSDRARLHTRIITNPRSAKALWNTLRQSLDEYEREFGTIEERTDG
jgi:hypothetical protein